MLMFSTVERKQIFKLARLWEQYAIYRVACTLYIYIDTLDKASGTRKL